MQHHRLLLTLVLLLAPPFAMAQDKPANTTPLPEWDQLSNAQRDELIAPLRDRWNSSPDERTRLYERAERWKAMPADARQRAHHGMQRWEKMSPEQRQHAQALFHAMRKMDKDERETFLAKWHAMTPQQRNDWVDAHPAPQRRRGPDRD
ncbi:DUF3106 domain-containing protein [Thermomonas sp.]|uniref:DUF3106 domain-containing protein n=1 Tax=Thermomonas sp. TaxID=1971895 RepID=UPI0024871DA0|nr:DUF3106 domain-containing protein [Thermomonas sp.]MDI1254424.1 DUF3106 domain-containing protein [Thermomonas sp.]